LEEAGRSLVGTWTYTMRRVVLPMVLPGALAGSLLAFVTALGEFVTSIVIYTIHNRPISIEILAQLRQFNFGSAAAYSVFLILLIGAAFVISEKYLSDLGNRTVS
jgi:iron(III) transport system permease protein